VQKESGKGFCNDALRAAYVRNNEEIRCPESLNGEATCSSGVLKYEHGYWHDGLALANPVFSLRTTELTYHFQDGIQLQSHSKFYRCVGFEHTCKVSDFDGAVTCRKGNSGVLCGVCTDGYTSDLTGVCTSCTSEGSDFARQGWGLVLIIMAIIFAVAVSCKLFFKHNSVLRSIKERLTSPLKITIAFFQIVLLVSSVYAVTWSADFLDFLSFFSFLEFDFLRMFKLGCIMTFTAHDTLHILGAVLLSLEAVVIGGLGILYLSSGSAEAAASLRFNSTRQGVSWLRQESTRAAIRAGLGWLLLTTYLIYPFSCKVLFSMFNCVEVDSVSYLRSELSIECESEAHQSAQVVAGFMIAAFPVGLPLLYFLMLRLNRRRLFDGDDKMAFLQFFYREYKEELYYWESVECLRKCLLMGFASFFQPGTLMQLVLVIILTVLYMLLLALCKPWESRVDDVLAILDQSMLFLVLVGALMLKVQQGFDSNGVFGEGYNSSFVTAMLITSTAIVTIAALFVFA
jgi:hypothetical protein